MKHKKLLARLLAAAVAVSTIVVSSFPASATLLDISEKNGYLTLSGYTADDLRSVPTTEITSNLRKYSYYDDKYDISADSKIVYINSSDTKAIISDSNGTVDLAAGNSINPYRTTNNLRGEYIIGSGKQLDPNNVRYDIYTTVTGKYEGGIADFSLYLRNETGSEKLTYSVNKNSYYSTYVYEGDSYYSNSYSVSKDDYSVRLNKEIKADEKLYLFVEPQLMNLSTNTPITENVTVKAYSSAYLTSENDISDMVLSTDTENGGYVIPITSRYTNIYLAYYVDGVVVDYYCIEYTIINNNLKAEFTLYDANGEANYYEGSYSQEGKEDVDSRYLYLNGGYTKTAPYGLRIAISDNGDEEELKNRVAGVFKGHYDTYESALESGETDIKEDILNTSKDNLAFIPNLSTNDLDLTLFVKERDNETVIRPYKFTLKLNSYEFNMSLYKGNCYLYTTSGYNVSDDVEQTYSDSGDSITFTLKTGYRADNSYKFRTYLGGNSGFSLSELNTAVYVGNYATREEATGNANLINGSSYYLEYTGNYSEGIDFTLFADVKKDSFYTGDPETYVYHFTVKVNAQEVSDPDPDPDPIDPSTLDFDIPVIRDIDPWFHITGATTEEGTPLDSWVIENSYYRNLDTYYGYGYQTLFINDENVDLSKIKLNVSGTLVNKVFRMNDNGEQVSQETVDFSQVQDFGGDGIIQYAIISQSKTKNYFIRVIKKTSGSKLFVNGPSGGTEENPDRLVYFDDYFGNIHDILIANVGTSDLTGLSVELNAKNVKLDDYWTVGGENNDTLKGFSTTAAISMNNIAKIRLVPDGESGEISGTLTIKAAGQDDVKIQLSGNISKINITSTVLPEAVKYVPYSALIATDNMFDFRSVRFAVTSGTLPTGIEINEKTGELYGAPQEVGDFTFTVAANVYNNRTASGYPLAVARKEFTITVNENTNDNVFDSSDDNYEIKTPIGVEQTPGEHDFVLENYTGDQKFISNGSFSEFEKLWLNGKELKEGSDYTKEEGSTVITIRAQTLSQLPENSVNTLAAEFRQESSTSGSADVDGYKVLTRTAQNFVIKKSSSDNPEINPGKDSSKPGSGSSNTGTGTGTSTNASTSGTVSSDSDKANPVISLINKIPANVTESDRKAVEDARKAYNELSDTEKAKVMNYSKLTDAENKLKTSDAVSDNSIDGASSSEDQSSDSNNADNDSLSSVVINGTVYTENGELLLGALIELHSYVKLAKTDANGMFKISGVEFGDHRLVIKNADGESHEKLFKIVSGKKTKITDSVITVAPDATINLDITFSSSGLSFAEPGEAEYVSDESIEDIQDENNGTNSNNNTKPTTDSESNPITGAALSMFGIMTASLALAASAGVYKSSKRKNKKK